VGKKALESLIRAGALDDFGDRSGMLEVIDRIISLAQSEAHLRNSQQTSMFDMMGDSMPAELASIDIPDMNTSDAEKGQWEQELLGVSTSNNALLDLLARSREANEIVMLKDLQDDMVGKRVKVTGMVSDVTRRYTRDQKPFAIATLFLMDGSLEVFIWDEKLQETDSIWEEGKLVAVTGNVRQRDDDLSLSCMEVREVVLSADSELTRNGANGAVESHDYDDAVTHPAATRPVNGKASHQKEPALSESRIGINSTGRDTAAVAETSNAYTGNAPAGESDAPPWDQPVGGSISADTDEIDDVKEGSDLQEDKTTEFEAPNSPVNGANGHARQTGNGTHALPSSPVNASPVNSNPVATAAETQRLLLRLTEGDPEHDKRMLYDLRIVLMDYRGESEVTLEITTAGRIVEMEWPAVRVLAGDELLYRLNSEVLGESGEACLVPETPQ